MSTRAEEMPGATRPPGWFTRPANQPQFSYCLERLGSAAG